MMLALMAMMIRDMTSCLPFDHESGLGTTGLRRRWTRHVQLVFRQVMVLSPSDCPKGWRDLRAVAEHSARAVTRSQLNSTPPFGACLSGKRRQFRGNLAQKYAQT